MIDNVNLAKNAAIRDGLLSKDKPPISAVRTSMQRSRALDRRAAHKALAAAFFQLETLGKNLS